MTTPNLRQYSDNAFLPRDMRCLGYDAQKNCYVFRKRNDIWLGIFGAEWDGAKLVKFGRIQQDTLDEGVLDNLSAIPEYPPDYTEEPQEERMEGLRPMSTSTISTEISSRESSAESPLCSPNVDYDEMVSAWGVAGVSITASGAPPPDPNNRLLRRASHLISSLKTHHPHFFNARQRNGATTSQRRPNPRASI